jgi:uncharacterized protein YfeS
MESNEKLELLGLSKKEVSDEALSLLTNDFYWSPIEESSPFGNDEGSDAFQYFRDWRRKNKKTSPVKFVTKLIDEWEYPKFDLTELDERKIAEYLEIKGPSIDSQLPMMQAHFKQLAEASGKEFDEKQFLELIGNVSNGMGSTYLLGQDKAIIAVGFGQFVLEGWIDDDMADLTKTALTRELLPVLISRWDNDYQQVRTQILKQMLSDLAAMAR